MQVSKQQLELDMDQQTGSKSEKAVYCHSAYLIYMQSTSWGMLGWMKHQLEHLEVHGSRIAEAWLGEFEMSAIVQ